MTKFCNENLSVILLSLFIYSYGLNYILASIIPPTVSAYIMYSFIGVLSIVAATSLKRINTNVVIFCIVYIVIAVINAILVMYPYYVIIESFTGIVNMLLPMIVIGSKVFCIKKFVDQWLRFAVALSFFIPVIIYLHQLGWIDYGVFTYVNVPNVIVLSWVSFNNDRNKIRYTHLCLSLVNLFAVLIFGGRMASLSAFFSLCMSLFLCSYVRFYKKILSICFLLICSIYFYYNAIDILSFMYSVLNKYNFSSRNIFLLMDQMNSINGDIYLTSRDYIYDIVWHYIINRYGLPGGFGVTLFLTDGTFYHPHNFFLQVFSIMGIFGGIVFLCCIAYRLVYARKILSDFDYRFMLIILLDYFVISLSGASILSNYLSLIGFGLLFLYVGEK